jgi:O-acetyl-ADP-ribose deacetylase (regulator of RNase III)
MCKKIERHRMKIVTKIGNLMDVTTGHIVHGCNAQGVMGSGVALAVKRKYPRAYEDYLRIHLDHGLVLGVAYPYSVSADLVIWNAITQEGFGAPTRNCSYDAIQTCFEQINETVPRTDVVRELHIPMIGAGLGGGNWEIIREIIEQTVTVPTTLWILPS